ESLRAQIRSAEKLELAELATAAPELQEKLVSIRRGAEEIRLEWKKLWEQAQYDRRQVAEAGRRDAEKLREKLLITQCDPQLLTDMLLDEELQGRVDELLEWSRWLGGLAPACSPPEPER